MKKVTLVNGKVDVSNLSAKTQARIISMIEKGENLTEAQKERERKALEKESLKRSYTGFYTIFNLIKKEGSFKSIKGGKFEKFAVLGSMNFNEFLAQLTKQGRYSFNEVYKFIDLYDTANDGDKVLIAEKGLKIDEILLNVKNETLTIQQAIEQYIVLCGTPFRINSKKEKVSTLTKSSAKYLFSNFNALYTQFGCAELFAEQHSFFMNDIKIENMVLIEEAQA